MLLVACLVLVAGASSVAKGAPRTPVTPELLLSEFASPEQVPRYDWIPGSERLVTATAAGTMRIVDARDGRGSDIGVGRRPQPSPDGRWLLFLAPEGEWVRPWVCRLDGGDRRVLCRPPGSVACAAWSNDGRRVAYAFETSATRASVSDELRPFDAPLPITRIQILTLDNGAQENAVDQRGEIRSLAWTADGGALVYRLQGTQNFYARSGIWAEVRAFDLASRKIEVVSRGPTGQQIFVSPSGRFVAFLGDRSPVFEPTAPYIGVYDRRTRRTTVLTPPDFRGYPQPDITWMAADEGLLFTARVKAGQPLLRVSRIARRGDAWSPPAVRACPGLWVTSPRLTADGRSLAFVGLDFQGRQVLMRSDSELRAPRRIGVLTPRIDTLALGEAAQIEWTSRDGLRLGGVLVKPPGYVPGRACPLVVDIHGGPDGGVDRAGSLLCTTPLEWQMWAARGYLVLAVDYRRSMACGWDVFLRTRQRQDYFERDYDDITSGIDKVIATAHADPRRIALIGHSWGGAEVLNAITRTHRFRAAIAYEGRADDYARYGTGFALGGDSSADYQYRGRPWEVPQNYLRNSPAWRVQGVTTPTLLFITEPSAFTADNEFMYTALLRQHVETDLVRYKGENHLVMQPAHQRDLLLRAVKWVDDHLRP